MTERNLNRREFEKLTAAALGGLAAGSLLGCSPKANPPAVGAAGGDKHLCRGLNECKGQGQGGKNECRGQGACATVVSHACGGHNDCKGLGGCGDTVGENACKGQGGCHVPLMDSAWDKLRKKKETEWGAKQQNFSAPPAKSS